MELLDGCYDHSEIRPQPEMVGKRFSLLSKWQITEKCVDRYLSELQKEFIIHYEHLYLSIPLLDEYDAVNIHRAFPSLLLHNGGLYGKIPANRLEVLYDLSRLAFSIRGYNNEASWCLFELKNSSLLNGLDKLIDGTYNYFDFVGLNIDIINNWIVFNSIYAGIFNMRQPMGDTDVPI